MQAQRRTIDSKSEAPAPTAYQIAPPAPAGPSWTFPSTFRDLVGFQDDEPAPGDYSAPVRTHLKDLHEVSIVDRECLVGYT